MHDGEMTQDDHRAGAKIMAMIKAAESGDHSGLPEVRQVPSADPQLVEDVGNLAVQAELSWMEAIIGDNLKAKEALRLKLSSLRNDLAGPNSTPLERLLVERVVACWLQVQYADTLYAQRLRKTDLSNIRHIERLQDKAHNRYVSAIRALAQIRRLNIPVLQLNIAEKQMNVMGGINAPPAPTEVMESLPPRLEE